MAISIAKGLVLNHHPAQHITLSDPSEYSRQKAASELPGVKLLDNNA